MRGGKLICHQFSIPMFFSRSLSVLSDFSEAGLALVSSGKDEMRSLTSMPFRSRLLTMRTQQLHLRSNAPWPQPRKKQPLALRLVKNVTKEN